MVAPDKENLALAAEARTLKRGKKIEERVDVNGNLLILYGDSEVLFSAGTDKLFQTGDDKLFFDGVVWSRDELSLNGKVVAHGVYYFPIYLVAFLALAYLLGRRRRAKTNKQTNRQAAKSEVK